MRYALIVGLVWLSSALPVMARDYMIRGSGTKSCGKWVEDHQKQTMAGLADDSWLMGYITAVNAHVLTKSSDIAAGTDLAGMVGWMNNHCRAHPLDSVDTAANELVLALLKKSGAF